jgi:Holliday junction DNA helicase RuvB
MGDYSPAGWIDFVGQPDAVGMIRRLLKAAARRGDQAGHVLIKGPGGLGKSELLHLIAKSIGGTLHDHDATAFEKIDDLIDALDALQSGDVFGIDEVHGIKGKKLLCLYRALAKGEVSVGRQVIKLPPFTCVAATTDPNLLTASFRTRFAIEPSVTFYSVTELAEVVTRAGKLSMLLTVEPNAARVIGERSRGIPRTALRLLDRVRDAVLLDPVQAAKPVGERVATTVHVLDAMNTEGIDDLGLTRLDREVLTAVAVKWAHRPVGIAPILRYIPDPDARTSVAFLERYDLIEATDLGREVTLAGLQHLYGPDARLPLTRRKRR